MNDQIYLKIFLQQIALYVLLQEEMGTLMIIQPVDF